MAVGILPSKKARYLKFQKPAAKGKIDTDRLPPTEMQQQNIPFVYTFSSCAMEASKHPRFLAHWKRMGGR